MKTDYRMTSRFVLGLGRYRTAEVLSIHLTDVRPPRPRDRDGWYNKIVIDAVILIWPEMTSDNYRSRNGNDRETSRSETIAIGLLP